jgi:thiamine biosynthesis lipoprotein
MFDLLFDLDPTPFREEQISLLRASREAMATSFEVVLPSDERALLNAHHALDLIDQLEAQLTVYRDDSEVSQLNQRASREQVSVEANLFRLLQLAGEISRETQGCFDLSTGALIKAWGFYKRQGRVPSVTERAQALEQTGMRHVILDAEMRSVRYLRPGLEINLGAIGKGYALDRVREMLIAEGASSGLVHGGASSVLAWGSPSSQRRGWKVNLLHPWQHEQILGTLELRDEALGTSAATFQFFEYNGRKLGHLLDPRTGWPAEKMNQVSVVAPTAAEADALSTALFVMGLEGTREFCRTHPRIGAIVLPTGDNALVECFNLRPEQFVANTDFHR